jgi:hypothetical protein
VFILLQGSADARNGDTMILDSVAGHRKTAEMLTGFLASAETSIEISAAGPCHLCPDWPTLQTFRMVKTDQRLKTKELAGGVLEVSGRPELLARYVQGFHFEPTQDGDHCHPEYALAATGDIDSTSESIIIEVDRYADDPDGWAAYNAGSSG